MISLKERRTEQDGCFKVIYILTGVLWSTHWLSWINILKSSGDSLKLNQNFFNLDSLSNTRLTPLHLVSLIVTLRGILPKDIRWQSSTKLESKGTKILVKTFKTFSSNSFFPTLSGMLEISKHTLREYSLFLLYFRS